MLANVQMKRTLWISKSFEDKIALAVYEKDVTTLSIWRAMRALANCCAVK